MVAIWLEWGRREGKAGGELMPSQEEMGIHKREGKGIMRRGLHVLRSTSNLRHCAGKQDAAMGEAGSRFSLRSRASECATDKYLIFPFDTIARKYRDRLRNLS